jgi:hypothetical protein
MTCQLSRKCLVLHKKLLFKFKRLFNKVSFRKWIWNYFEVNPHDCFQHLSGFELRKELEFSPYLLFAYGARRHEYKFCPFYEGVSKSFWTGRLERELQMVQLSATRCSCVAIFLVSLVSFAAITLCIASQRVFVVVVLVYFVIDSVRICLDTPSYNEANHSCTLFSFS